MKTCLNEQTEEALGDGNCAFNAFALGLCTQKMLEAITTLLDQQGEDPDLVFKDFIDRVAPVLLPNQEKCSWDDIKKAMLKFREENKDALQKNLAPKLRELAIDLAVQDEMHLSCTYPILEASFNTFIKYCNLSDTEGIEENDISDDDIFIVHEHIKEKFNSLSKETNLNNPIESLQNWWAPKPGCISLDGKSGYELFLKNMRENGQWAGDLELYQLARYFRTNVLEVTKKHNIYLNYGFLPLQLPNYNFHSKKDTLGQLITRGIINPPCNDNQFITPFLLSKEETMNRLKHVPCYKEIVKKIKGNKKNLKGTSVPSEILTDEACFAQLRGRNVITIGKEHYCFAVGYTDAIKRMKAIPNYKDVTVICEKHHQTLPTIMLSNDGSHWSNVLSLKDTAEPNLSFPEKATFSNKDYPVEFTFKSDADAEAMKSKLHHMEGVVVNVGKTLKISKKACQQGAVEKLLNQFYYENDIAQKAASYLAHRAKSPQQYYKLGLFRWLRSSVSRTTRCQEAWQRLITQKSAIKPNEGKDARQLNKNTPLNQTTKHFCQISSVA